jgi:adenylosuccinate lyase
MKIDFKNYQSPFSWRYGSEKMRGIFSEETKFKTWRKLWVALAKAQNSTGLISKEELADLEKNENVLNAERIIEIEKDLTHDVVSAIREFAEVAKIGGGKIHLGATSQDIVDNAETLRNKEALLLIEKKLISVLKLFEEKIIKYSDLPCMGYTHLQPAEPTTLGYRFAFYAQDILHDLEYLRFTQKIVKGKGLKGAVGTAASYSALLTGTNMSASQLEERFLKDLGIDAVLISSQVNPRKFDYFILNVLSSISSSVAKFAFDLRIMQSPGFGEWAEPFGKKQVGSSAMPFKKNPWVSEKVCSLARYVTTLPPVALENASVSLLERTLDDSANKRIIMPEAFLATDEILDTANKLLAGMIINENKIGYNLNQYAPFSATELIIIEAVKKGADRQKMHELLREISMRAWAEVADGNPNPMKKLLLSDLTIGKYLDGKQIDACLDVNSHVGDAPERAKKLVEKIAFVTKSA